jgi:hypothetical protein
MSFVSTIHRTLELADGSTTVFETLEKKFRISELYPHQGRGRRQNNNEHVSRCSRRRWCKPVATCSVGAIAAIVMLLRTTSGFCSRVGIHSRALVAGHRYVTVHLVTA